MATPDKERLRTAIKILGRMWARSELPAGSEAHIVLDAASAVLEAPEVEWCEKHRLPRADGIEEVCAIGYMPLFDESLDLPCRLTRVFFVPSQPEETL